MSGKTVNIRPGVSVLGLLKNLNYRPWFALAEFVDNAIQSFLDHRDALAAIEAHPVLHVALERDDANGGAIVIRDDAAGIRSEDFPRAFRPAAIPPDRHGLSEFGMGMKSAACWFSPYWIVRTTAFGDPVEREITFDIDKIVHDNIEELQINERPIEPMTHFTEITLTRLHEKPVGRTVGKIKAHLAEIYRVFTREGTLELMLDGSRLEYQEPEALQAPEYNDANQPVGDPREWLKEIDFDFGEGLRANGFAGLRATASTTEAGFSLFRRKRLIVGSSDEKYRPQRLVGTPNTYPAQRVFGELHLEGFDVTHTKDGFKWDEAEEPFLDLLKEELDKPPLRLLRQANNFRAKQNRRDLKRAAAQVGNRTAKALEKGGRELITHLSSQNTPQVPVALPAAEELDRRVIDLSLEGEDWRILLELSNDPAVGDWLSLAESRTSTLPAGRSRESVGLRLNLAHPFMQRFAGSDPERIEPLLRVAAAIGLAEKLARRGGILGAGAVRAKLNRVSP